MRPREWCRIVVTVSVAMATGLAWPVQAAEKTAAPGGFATRTRPLWTTSRVVGSPEPPDRYTLAVAYEQNFDQPLSMDVVPGSNRLAIAERYGKVFTIPLDRRAADRSLLLELPRTIYGIAFHPGFQQNGRLFVTSIPDPENTTEDGSRLSEFRVDRGNLTADPASEQVLLTWPNGGHNGGCLRFGPDGFLYLSTGDASGIADERLTGQDLSDLAGSLLRIDVDRPSDGRRYGIPADNPFVGVAGARPEIFSFGHRQIWKFSFDRATGLLWGGEVGQDLWEMIYLIRKGGNYAWSVREGSHPFRPERPQGPGGFVDPVVEHPHSDFRSITCGFVYHGSRLPELRGHLIYGDYDTGRIWSLKYDTATGQVVAHGELCDEQIRLIEFCQTPDGEVLLLDFVSGRIHELVPAPPPSADAPPFPRRLSETGLFASTRDHTPATGVIPYDVVAPLWSDHAGKERFLAVPGDGRIEFDTVIYPQPAPGSSPTWRFPDGTVLVKTFWLELEAGNPASRKRLETRLLHHRKMPGKDDEYGAQVWNGYTYVWNDGQTDAELLDAQGLDREYEIRDAAAPGGVRRQTWHFPSRSECTLCHTMAAHYVLGVTTPQMNRSFDYGGTVGVRNQIGFLNELGLFTQPVPRSVEELDRLVDYRDDDAPLADRARAYLHANCSHCHRKWGGGNAEFQLLATLPLEDTGTVSVRPAHGGFQLNDPKLLVPGAADRSLIWFRMNHLGLGRMPHIASTVRDEQAIELIRRWIDGL